MLPGLQVQTGQQLSTHCLPSAPDPEAFSLLTCMCNWLLHKCAVTWRRFLRAPQLSMLLSQACTCSPQGRAGLLTMGGRAESCEAVVLSQAPTHPLFTSNSHPSVAAFLSGCKTQTSILEAVRFSTERVRREIFLC